MRAVTLRHATRAVVALGVAVGTMAGCAPDPIRSTLNRPADPVVITGGQVSRLAGAPVDRVVAFSASSAGWSQIPVQVDERLNRLVSQVYGPGVSVPGTNASVNVYADPNTHVGPDTTAGVDADDEIAFMAYDAGGPAPTSLARPAGTVASSGVEVRLHDPDDTAAAGYVYLFRSDGSLDPSAGRSYVSYNFSLLSGDYKTTYNRLDGPNPENSSITGATYTAHFSDRWLFDQLTISVGDRPGVDLIDRAMYRFPGSCGRHEDTFDDAEGAFVVNRVGPVRALRSYVGANSGPNTQATHAFYRGLVDTTIDLRVHLIPGVGATLDLNQQANGMTYRNPQVPGGVTVDGNPDTVPAATPSWWTYLGSQGGLGVASSVESNLSLNPQTYYQDDLTPTGQCTGDGQAVGEAGAFFYDPIACTDPGQGCANTLRSKFRIVALPNNFAPAEVQRITAQGLRPLTTTFANRN